MSEHADVEIGELYRTLGLIKCNRMLFAFSPEVEAEMDREAAVIEREIERRTAELQSPSQHGGQG